MFPNELQARKDIVYYSHKTHAAGLVSATDGNLSVRLDENHVLITPSSLRKEDMFIDAPIVIDMEGNLVVGDRKPSTEYKVHLEAYKQRPDIGAVIHAHPPKAVAFTIAEVPLDTCMLPEVVVTMGNVPVAPYAAPSTEALPESMRELIKHTDALMLARHGSVTVGPNLADAFKKLEKLEHNAEIMIYARILGGAKPFSTAELKELQGLRSFYGITTHQVACTRPGGEKATVPGAASSGTPAAGPSTASSAAPSAVPSGGQRVEPRTWTASPKPAVPSPQRTSSGNRSWGRYDDGEVQAPTYRVTSGHASGNHEQEIDALVDEIVARVKKRL